MDIKQLAQDIATLKAKYPDYVIDVSVKEPIIETNVRYIRVSLEER